MSKFQTRETQVEFFKRFNIGQQESHKPDLESKYEIPNIVGLSIKDEEPDDLYFKTLKKEINNRPDPLMKQINFRKPKKSNVHKNNIEMIL